LGGLAVEPEVGEIHAKANCRQEKDTQGEQEQDDRLATLVSEA